MIQSTYQSLCHRTNSRLRINSTGNLLSGLRGNFKHTRFIWLAIWYVFNRAIHYFVIKLLRYFYNFTTRMKKTVSNLILIHGQLWYTIRHLVTKGLTKTSIACCIWLAPSFKLTHNKCYLAVRLATRNSDRFNAPATLITPSTTVCQIYELIEK